MVGPPGSPRSFGRPGPDARLSWRRACTALAIPSEPSSVSLILAKLPAFARVFDVAVVVLIVSALS